MKILVVDDEMEWVETLIERFALRGIAAHGAPSGHEALQIMDEQSFDVVLLDVKMPGINGLEVLKMIKSKFPDQRVIMLTGHGSRNDAGEGIRLGAYDYLMKPVNIEDLITVLKSAANKRTK